MAALVSALLMAMPSVALAAPPSFDYQREVVHSFTDAAGRPVVMRRGY
ncbi:hypothetical protein ACFQE5_21645 [Pseudonocardia hispaniensis]|uniref:DUF4124 domain-containing protein n=1 Tax=Pseudonocardia hispaniensis TaxID=904933 RepID=A0ABW1J8S8_9PSEU